jgi:AraC-like DNA-binding protein
MNTNGFFQRCQKRVALFSLVLLSFTTTAGQEGNHQLQIDSLWQVIDKSEGKDKLKAYTELNDIIYYYETRIEQQLAFFDKFEKEAQKQKSSNDEAAVKRNRLIKLFETNHYDDVIVQMPGVLDFLYAHQQWKYFCELHKGYALSYQYTNQSQKAVDVATRFYEQAKQIDYPDALPYSLHFLGLLYQEQGRKKDAVESFRQALAEAKKNPRVTDIRIDAYFYFVQLSISQMNLEDAETALAEWEADLKKLEDDEEGGKEIPSLRSSLYRMCISLHSKKMDLDKVEAYLDKIEKLGYTSTNVQLSTLLNRANLCFRRGNYAQMLEYADKGIALAEQSGTSRYVLVFFKPRMQALINLDNPKTTELCLDRLLFLTDSIHDLEGDKQLDELRTQYEVDKITAEKERNRNYFLFALGGCGLLAIALGIWIYYSRLVTRKNRTLVMQIKELQAEQQRRDEELLRKTTFETLDAPALDDAFRPESSYDKLCLVIRDLLLKDKVYRNPALNRDGMVERLGTSKNLFIDAFQQCFNKSFTDYINELRLNDAIALLEQSDISIEEISEKVGFGTGRTFRRQFQAKYNISPQNYRKLSK